MTDEVSRTRRAVKVIRWIARIWSLLALGFVALMLVGEVVSPHAPPPSSARDIVGLALFPFGVCLGILLAWRWEALGGGISVASFLVFYAALWLFDGRLPRGPYFALVAAPGFLFLACSLLDRGTQQEEST